MAFWDGRNDMIWLGGAISDTFISGCANSRNDFQYSKGIITLTCT